MTTEADEKPRAQFRWRVADWQVTGSAPREQGVPTLELAIFRAEEWLSSPCVAGAVAIIWASGSDRGWHPVLFGITGEDRMAWYPWVMLAGRGGELVAATGQDGAPPGVISAFAGGDLATVVTGQGKPSMVARAALLNAALHADEVAGQAAGESSSAHKQ